MYAQDEYPAFEPHDKKTSVQTAH